MPQRLYLPRVLGMMMAGTCVAGGLWQVGAPAWLWTWLAFNALVWPHLAYQWSRRCASPKAGEHRNLLLDAASGAFWLPAIGFNLLPSVLIIAILLMNCTAVGGVRLALRGAVAQVAGVSVGLVLLPWRLQPLADFTAVLACLPLLVVYPLTLGYTNYRLSRRLTRKAQQLEQSERLYRDTLDAMDASVVLYDADDRLVLWNEDFRRHYGALGDALRAGMTFEQLIRQLLAQGLIPDALGREEDWLGERLQTHRQPGAAHLRRLPNGSWRRVVEKRLSDGSLLAYSSDVTELIEKEKVIADARQEAERARRLLEDAIDALPDGFALYDPQDRLVVCNAAYKKMYAAAADAIRPGVAFEEVTRYALQHGQFPAAAGREEAWLAERVAQHRNPGAPVLQQLPDNRWVRVDEHRTREGGVAGVRVDVTELVRREQQLQQLMAERDTYERELREANERLRRLSQTDGLTGLANRREFDRRLHEEWQRAQRRGLPLALLMVDVDHFKHYNDRYGHPAGDDCLRRIARLLQGCARRSGDLVARYGGEEFALLLPGADAAEAQAVAQLCIDAVDAAALPHGDSPVAGHVTLSVGVASGLITPAMVEPAELVQQADAALYRAKQAGRHRVVDARPAVLHR